MVSQNYGVNISVITYCVHFPVNCFWETVYSVCATHTSAELWMSAIQVTNLGSRFFSDLHRFYESLATED